MEQNNARFSHSLEWPVFSSGSKTEDIYTYYAFFGEQKRILVALFLKFWPGIGDKISAPENLWLFGLSSPRDCYNKNHLIL